ncbi:MAG: flavoprotein [Candidatus Omnitrophota bacterium]
MNKKNVLIGVTGSIACYRSAELVRSLCKKNISVHIVLTKETEEFIRPLLFQGLSGNKVVTYNMFDTPDKWDIEHVSLAKKADLVVVMPATANIIAKVAAGICDDMLTCTICASEAPVLFVPAMNKGMYKNKIVQENIAKLKKLGYFFSGPIKGKLACGDEGLGHIQDVEIVVKEVNRLLR